MEVDFGPGDVVLDGVTAPPESGTTPEFSSHVYCGQTTPWLKMPYGTEIGLGPGNIVLDGNPARSPQKGHSPQFSS